jgi:hypothetical protein
LPPPTPAAPLSVLSRSLPFLLSRDSVRCIVGEGAGMAEGGGGGLSTSIQVQIQMSSSMVGVAVRPGSEGLEREKGRREAGGAGGGRRNWECDHSEEKYLGR